MRVQQLPRTSRPLPAMQSIPEVRRYLEELARDLEFDAREIRTALNGNASSTEILDTGEGFPEASEAEARWYFDRNTFRMYYSDGGNWWPILRELRGVVTLESEIIPVLDAWDKIVEWQAPTALQDPLGLWDDANQYWDLTRISSVYGATLATIQVNLHISVENSANQTEGAGIGLGIDGADPRAAAYDFETWAASPVGPSNRFDIATISYSSPKIYQGFETGNIDNVAAYVYEDAAAISFPGPPGPGYFEIVIEA